MTRIEVVDAPKAKEYVKDLILNDEEKWGMDYCMVMSTHIWVGLIDDRLACIWGLIPPTLMSNQAYLWLYTTDVIKEHQFILVRHSQLVMEEILKEYPSVCGHAIIGNHKAIRWLKWLGAKFGEPQGKGIPFRIRRNG
jgi:hypothetical protein